MKVKQQLIDGPYSCILLVIRPLSLLSMIPIYHIHFFFALNNKLMSLISFCGVMISDDRTRNNIVNNGDID